MNKNIEALKELLAGLEEGAAYQKTLPLELQFPDMDARIAAVREAIRIMEESSDVPV